MSVERETHFSTARHNPCERRPTEGGNNPTEAGTSDAGRYLLSGEEGHLDIERENPRASFGDPLYLGPRGGDHSHKRGEVTSKGPHEQHMGTDPHGQPTRAKKSGGRNERP